MGLSKLSKLQKVLFLVLILLFPVFLLMFLGLGEQHLRQMPFYGPKEPVTTVVDGETVVDTIYHRIPDFVLTDQDGKPFDRSRLDGNIVIADFIFTSCPTICPKMTFNLRELQKRLAGYPGVQIISHTIDPRHDTPEALKAYAIEQKVDLSNWSFLTGPKEEMYPLAKEGYLLTANESDEESDGGFVHSNKVVLVDTEGHIRGFYDGTSWAEVKTLIEEVKMLVHIKFAPKKSDEDVIEQKR